MAFPRVYHALKLVSSLLIAIALTVLSCSAFAQSIVNGSFEAVQIPPGSSGITNLADVPGWTHSGATGDGFLWHTGPVCCGGTGATVAPDGLQFVTMGGGFGPTGSSAWSQNIIGLTIGDSYVVSFMIAAEGELPTQTVDVAMTSGSSTGSKTFTTPVAGALFWTNWGTMNYSFVATDNNATLQFSVTNEVFDTGLDNVSIAPAVSDTPEPGSILLMGSGFVGLIGTLRKRLR